MSRFTDAVRVERAAGRAQDDVRWGRIVDALAMLQGFIESDVSAEEARDALNTLNKLVR